MVLKKFRFGVSLHTNCGRDEWIRKCRRMEQIGFDVILVPDHLHMPAPFPSVVAAASVTKQIKVGTFVLNAGFWNARLLIREIATTHRLTGGRLEIGIGTGYVSSEFDEAEIPWTGPGERVDRLKQIVERLRDDFAARSNWKDCEEPPRLLVGGSGRRVLGIASDNADSVGMSPVVRVDTPEKWRALPAETLEERCAFVRDRAKEQARDVEMNVMVPVVIPTQDRQALAEEARRERAPYLTVEQILDTPAAMFGTADEMVEQLWQRRERYGISYVSVHEESAEALAPVIAQIKDS